MNEGGSLAIRHARAILPDEVVQADVIVAEGRIQSIGTSERADRIVDGRGLILAPAMIDLHGDAFERQVMPRSGVFAPPDVALLKTDRQLAANGIATAYHALTLSWEPGLRSVAQGAAFLRGLGDLASRFTVENRVQLRWESFAFEAMDLIETALAGPLTPSIAFNDHTSMAMRDFDTPIQERAFEMSPDFAVAALDDPRMRHRLTSRATRARLSVDEYLALMARVWERRPDVPASITRVAGMGRSVDAPMLSHDDTQPETRAYFRGLGAEVAEFPMVRAAAEAARAGGDAIVLGAPNVMRGGSHLGSLGAADMIEAGLCDALASDYFYPSLLAAIARLDAERRGTRSELWSLVSAGPARAMRLPDRGAIRPGARADLVLLDWPEEGAPNVRRTFSMGRTAYLGLPLGA